MSYNLPAIRWKGTLVERIDFSLRQRNTSAKYDAREGSRLFHASVNAILRRNTTLAEGVGYSLRQRNTSAKYDARDRSRLFPASTQYFGEIRRSRRESPFPCVSQRNTSAKYDARGGSCLFPASTQYFGEIRRSQRNIVLRRNTTLAKGVGYSLHQRNTSAKYDARDFGDALGGSRLFPASTQYFGEIRRSRLRQHSISAKYDAQRVAFSLRQHSTSAKYDARGGSRLFPASMPYFGEIRRSRRE